MQFKIYNGSTVLATVSNVATYTATDLKPLTSYTFGVVASNGVRESPKVSLAVTTRGIQFKIPQMLTVGAVITLRYQEYSLGLLAIGKEPAGMFGGGNKKNLSAKVITSANGSSIVELTSSDANFADGTMLNKLEDGSFGAFSGAKAIYFG
ncbi:fibronectin type III domain-containing protein [Lapidilactobacillus luobeiensis]|uniref:fibronectin type III domain-containing protein n=1 Tax=Lapidilactobacillus luobeiensis TaxID=2950371 RepID=UPI0021C294FE|nr:fibronectin type III domain-containing protein [Lapidilactobacillus luobeiensis]